MTFEEKYFSRNILLTAEVHFLIAFPLEKLNNVCLVIICCPVCDALNFEIKDTHKEKAPSNKTRQRLQKVQISKSLVHQIDSL